MILSCYTYALKEILASSGYSTVQTLNSNISAYAMAIDPAGNLLLSTSTQLEEILAASGYQTVKNILSLDDSNGPEATGIATDAAGHVFLVEPVYSVIQEVPEYGVSGTVQELFIGYNFPAGVAIDPAGNIFIADSFSKVIKEVSPSGAVDILGRPNISGFQDPSYVLLDQSRNLYVFDGFLFYEMPAAGGYQAVESPYFQGGDPFAFDSAGNRFVSTSSGNGLPPTPGSAVTYTFTEYLAAGGSKQLFTTTIFAQAIALDASDNFYLATQNQVIEFTAASGYSTSRTLGSGFNNPFGLAVDAYGNVFVSDTGNNAVKEILVSPPALVASVLPGSRSVQIGEPATVSATMINTGAGTLDNCHVALPSGAPAGLSLSYQTTDATTNGLIGTPNTPVSLSGNNGIQSFVITLQSNAAFDAPAMPLVFACDNSPPAASIAGVDTVDLAVSDTATADIIALAATPTANGVITVPNGASAAFAVASVNIGAEEAISVTVDTGSAKLPVAATICQTDPGTGQCLYPATGVAQINYAGGWTPTFSIFLKATGAISFAPASSRIFVRFQDASGTLRGSTSVAVQTD